MAVASEECFRAELLRFGCREVLLGEQTQQSGATLIERQVLDLVSEDCGELALAIEKSQDAAADEDLAPRECEGAPEAEFGIEVEMVGQLARRVRSNTVAHSLQIVLDALSLPGGREATVRCDFFGKDVADADLVGVGEGRVCGEGVHCTQN
jgi:hypothetical protein